MSSAGQRVNDRYHFRSNDFLTFTITPWFNNRYAMAILSKNKKRIAKYKKIKISELVAEYPRAIFRDGGYFHTTITARPAGLCFPDPKVMFVPYPRFLSQIDPRNEMYENPLVPVDITTESLVEYALAQTTLPDSPTFYLTNIKDEPDVYAVLVLCSNDDVKPDDFVKPLIGGYHFQRISVSLYTKDDEEYPTQQSDMLDGYLTGSAIVEEQLLKEQTLSFKIFNIKTIQDLFNTDKKEAFYNGELMYNGATTYSGVA